MSKILTSTNIDIMLKQLLVEPFSCVITFYFNYEIKKRFDQIMELDERILSPNRLKARVIINSQKFSILLMNREVSYLCRS